jgi:hypothetical protein
MALLQKKGWFCCKEGEGSNVIAFFYGGGVVKKSPFFFRSFWFSSLELTINNEMVVYF